MSEPNILLRDSVRKAHRRASHTAQASRGTGRRYQQSAFEFLFYESTTLKLYCTRYKAYYVPEYDLRYGCKPLLYAHVERGGYIGNLRLYSRRRERRAI